MKSLVVAHDAGGAELLAAWVTKSADVPKDFDFYSEGPARQIFRRMGLSNSDEVWKNTWEAYDTVYTGTSVGSTLENRAIALASESGVKSISVLDHWLNYPQRFENLDEPILPNEIWVVDSYALALAKTVFPNTPLVLQPNWYWENVKKAVLAMECRDCNHPNSNSSNWLFAMENRQYIGEHWKIGFDRINQWLDSQQDIRSVSVRLHPSMVNSDLAKEIQAAISQDSRFTISSGPLIEDLARCWGVVGFQTTVLALAVACGKVAVSLVNEDEKLVVPFPEIETPFSRSSSR